MYKELHIATDAEFFCGWLGDYTKDLDRTPDFHLESLKKERVVLSKEGRRYGLMWEPSMYSLLPFLIMRHRNLEPKKYDSLSMVILSVDLSESELPVELIEANKPNPKLEVLTSPSPGGPETHLVNTAAVQKADPSARKKADTPIVQKAIRIDLPEVKASQGIDIVISCNVVEVMDYVGELLRGMAERFPTIIPQLADRAFLEELQGLVTHHEWLAWVALPWVKNALPPADSSEDEETEKLRSKSDMAQYMKHYNPKTAGEIIEALPEAYTLYGSIGGIWGPGLIAKKCYVTATTIGRYLKAFRCAGYTEINGIPLPPGHRAKGGLVVV